jgi:hypothetical protein
LTRLIISGAKRPSSISRPTRKRRLQPERDLGRHVGELLLEQLVGRERLAELLAVEPVLSRGGEAELGRAHRPHEMP